MGYFTIDDLKAAIERRGFLVRLWLPEEDRVKAIVMLGNRSQAWEISRSVLASIKMGIGNLIEHEFRGLTQGWKFQQCVQCGTPVLASFKYVDEEQKCLKWYGVCSVEAGPYTEHLQVCSGCGVEFSYPPPLKEINDIGH